MKSAKKLGDQSGGYYNPQRRKDEGLNWGSGSKDGKICYRRYTGRTPRTGMIPRFLEDLVKEGDTIN